MHGTHCTVPASFFWGESREFPFTMSAQPCQADSGPSHVGVIKSDVDDGLCKTRGAHAIGAAFPGGLFGWKQAAAVYHLA